MALKSVKHKTFILLEDTENKDIASIASEVQTVIPKEYASDNVVIDILKFDKLTMEELLAFLNISNKHRKNRHSFVLVNTALETDCIPDELAVVPTLQEARDIIEMEEIERDLGF